MTTAAVFLAIILVIIISIRIDKCESAELMKRHQQPLARGTRLFYKNHRQQVRRNDDYDRWSGDDNSFDDSSSDDKSSGCGFCSLAWLWVNSTVGLIPRVVKFREPSSGCRAFRAYCPAGMSYNLVNASGVVTLMQRFPIAVKCGFDNQWYRLFSGGVGECPIVVQQVYCSPSATTTPPGFDLVAPVEILNVNQSRLPYAPPTSVANENILVPVEIEKKSAAGLMVEEKISAPIAADIGVPLVSAKKASVQAKVELEVADVEHSGLEPTSAEVAAPALLEQVLNVKVAAAAPSMPKEATVDAVTVPAKIDAAPVPLEAVPVEALIKQVSSNESTSVELASAEPVASAEVLVAPTQQEIGEESIVHSVPPTIIEENLPSVPIAANSTQEKKRASEEIVALEQSKVPIVEAKKVLESTIVAAPMVNEKVNESIAAKKLKEPIVDKKVEAPIVAIKAAVAVARFVNGSIAT